MIEELIARAFLARDITHYLHLTTKSFVEHSALNFFYNDIIEKIDNLAENVIGMFGEIGELPDLDRSRPDDIIAFLTDEGDWIETSRDQLTNGSESIGAIVDDLVSVYTHTVYRLGLK
ncbi:MAG: DUF5856 family protein [Smithella sp.]|jgi:hypothetical protein